MSKSMRDHGPGPRIADAITEARKARRLALPGPPPGLSERAAMRGVAVVVVAVLALAAVLWGWMS